MAGVRSSVTMAAQPATLACCAIARRLSLKRLKTCLLQDKTAHRGPPGAPEASEAHALQPLPRITRLPCPPPPPFTPQEKAARQGPLALQKFEERMRKQEMKKQMKKRAVRIG